MAHGYYFHPQSFSKQQYDTCLQKLEEAGAGSPPGRTYHAAFEVGGQIHVFDVWDSTEQFEAFGQTLMPILQELNVDPGEPSVSPVHNVIRG